MQNLNTNEAQSMNKAVIGLKCTKCVNNSDWKPK